MKKDIRLKTIKKLSDILGHVKPLKESFAIEAEIRLKEKRKKLTHSEVWTKVNK